MNKRVVYLLLVLMVGACLVWATTPLGKSASSTPPLLQDKTCLDVDTEPVHLDHAKAHENIDIFPPD